MKTLSPRKMDMDFPSNNYTKYKSQSKTNPFLSKLNQDAGYPQDILKTCQTLPVRSGKNYLQMNRKGLKNFFSDRLPPKEVEITRESFSMDPSRLFQIKKRQHELKNMTKSKLEEKLESTVPLSKLDKNKFGQIFQLNDKNEDFKKKFLSNQTTRVSQPYQRDNFLKGTACYVQKYSRITKKVAYESVFGPETSAVPRKSATARLIREDTTFTRPFTTIEQRKKYNVGSNSKQLERKKFSSLIHKIDTHRQSLDPQNKRGMSNYIPPQEILDNQQQKSEMITWIRDTAKMYKYNSIHANVHQIRQLDDIQKLDTKFYQDMKMHKAKRLGHRESYVQKLVMVGSSRVHNADEMRHQRGHDDKKSDNSLSDLSANNQSSRYSISSSEQQEEVKPKFRFVPMLLLKRFIRLLVDALQQARYFGIENKTNIYKAFWQNPNPYEKSGSYAFFKAIKKGDCQGVKKFIGADYDFLYQRDYKGRSPLLCAAMHNHDGIIDYLLTCDINVNKICFNHKTALYYAIKNGNVEVVKKLTQAGAIPWSTKRCCYRRAQEKTKSMKIDNLIKNARKIAIVVQLQPTKPQKIAMWSRIKHKIVQDQIVTFD